MQKYLKFGLAIIIGLALGFVLLWLLNPAQATRRAPVATTLNNQPAPSVAATVSPTLAARPVALTVQPPTAKPPVPSALGTEYLALGDSVAYGIGAPNPIEQGYAGLFYSNYLKRLQPDLQFYRNFAVPGETSASFITSTNKNNKSQLTRALEEFDNAAKEGRRISPLSLTIGGNDMLDARGKANPEREKALARFETNLVRILDALKAKAGAADFFITTYYNPYAYSSGGTDTEAEWLARFNNVIQKQAQSRNIKVVDFFTPIAGQERQLTWIGFGDVHPRPDGYSLLARALWQLSGYDKEAPKLTLTYTPLPAGSKASPNERLIFKLGVYDEWAQIVAKAGADFDIAGTGTIVAINAWLNQNQRLPLMPVPARYNKNGNGVQEYSLILDTTGLEIGQQTLHFEASDAAGNVGTLEFKFEIGEIG